ncbi:hypothetical protein [Mucilaginibacter hurinus]|uniref:hypothetical protein n=1 Tax=Mucilaginibacter hurinus TaxID=2201324 RepID=UPI0011BF0189|nr:hypothetical protein [Mucilaginibacter hurinus]
MAFLVIIAGCNNFDKFDRKRWSETKDGIEFTYRANMLDNLLQTHNFKGMKLKRVTDTLGRPQGFKKQIMYYDIAMKLDTMPPSYIKRLYIHFNADSVVTRTEIFEHDAKKKK